MLVPIIDLCMLVYIVLRSAKLYRSLERANATNLVPPTRVISTPAAMPVATPAATPPAAATEAGESSKDGGAVGMLPQIKRGIWSIRQQCSSSSTTTTSSSSIKAVAAVEAAEHPAEPELWYLKVSCFNR
jgi:hypothetical protein